MKVKSSRSHGQFTVCLLGERIISATLKGSFSERGIRDYINQVKEIIKRFDGKPFAMLINNLQVEGGTPEAYRALEKYNHWLNQQAITAKAFIFDDSITKQILLSRSPSLKQQNIAFFKTENEAKAWLEAESAKTHCSHSL